MPIYPQTQNGKTTYMVVATTQINGKQINRKRRSISSIAAAKRIELELKLELKILKEKPNRLTWDEWATKCVQRMSLEFKNSTIMGYQGNFRKWVSPYIGTQFLDELTTSTLHEIIFIKANKLSPEGQKTILKQIKRILTMAVDEGHLLRNPAKGISVKVPEVHHPVFNATEISILLTEAKVRHHRFFKYWALALLTGMRKGELHALAWSDVDYENKVLAVTKSWNSKDGHGPTKSSKNRYIPISSELEMFLRSLQANTANSKGKILEEIDEWVDGKQAKILKSFCLEIGITPIRFHDLRATFITQMLLKDVPLAKVMKIAGHASIKTTMKYLRLVAKDTEGATEALGIRIPTDHDISNVISFDQPEVYVPPLMRFFLHSIFY